MIRIPIAQHIEYLSQRFTLEEVNSICIYLDKKFVEMYATLGSNKDIIAEHNAIWKMLITTFNKLAPEKKAKAFVYQMLVINEIADDKFNGKTHCVRRHKTCAVEKTMLKSLNREWKMSDMDNLCFNLAICLELPWIDYFLDFDSSVKYIDIDDSILTTNNK